MISAYRSAGNLSILAIGIIMGCILAYLAHSPSSFAVTIMVSLLPFIIAILVGVAKTTTV